ncbi:MAG: hypothetical protein M1834_006078 [Cirrosporium novae-zelandiae]|nr:MAG: hypothetical protein M1834_006078 [Cirrosporium novae-zelandiae]
MSMSIPEEIEWLAAVAKMREAAETDADEEELQADINNPPRHPISTMQGPFEESMLETINHSDPERILQLDAPARRKLLLEKENYERVCAGRWKQKKNEKFHPLWKLVAQIAFGVHLLSQSTAKSEDEVIKILQTHVDDIDGFLETTTEDFQLAQDDIQERIRYLTLPLEHIQVFETMLNDRKFRTSIMDGNDKIEHIIDRTTSAMNDTLKDIQKGISATGELARYLDSLESSWRDRSEDMEAVHIAMIGNTEGWRRAFQELQVQENKLGVSLAQLKGMVAEIKKRAGSAKRKSLADARSMRGKYFVDPKPSEAMPNINHNAFAQKSSGVISTTQLALSIKPEHRSDERAPKTEGTHSTRHRAHTTAATRRPSERSTSRGPRAASSDDQIRRSSVSNANLRSNSHSDMKDYTNEQKQPSSRTTSLRNYNRQAFQQRPRTSPGPGNSRNAFKAKAANRKGSDLPLRNYEKHYSNSSTSNSDSTGPAKQAKSLRSPSPISPSKFTNIQPYSRSPTDRDRADSAYASAPVTSVTSTPPKPRIIIPAEPEQESLYPPQPRTSPSPDSDHLSPITALPRIRASNSNGRLTSKAPNFKPFPPQPLSSHPPSPTSSRPRSSSLISPGDVPYLAPKKPVKLIPRSCSTPDRRATADLIEFLATPPPPSMMINTIPRPPGTAKSTATTRTFAVNKAIPPMPTHSSSISGKDGSWKKTRLRRFLTLGHNNGGNSESYGNKKNDNIVALGSDGEWAMGTDGRWVKR